jgi:hypothetical protein
MSFQQLHIQPSPISSAPTHPSFASTTPVYPQYHHAFQHQAYGLPSSPHTPSQVTHPSNLLPPASGSYVPYMPHPIYMPPPPFENITTTVNNTQKSAVGTRKRKSTAAASGTKAPKKRKGRTDYASQGILLQRRKTMPFLDL